LQTSTAQAGLQVFLLEPSKPRTGKRISEHRGYVRQWTTVAGVDAATPVRSCGVA
jgi:hypothetical protein